MEKLKTHKRFCDYEDNNLAINVAITISECIFLEIHRHKCFSCIFFANTLKEIHSASLLSLDK